MNTSKGNTGSHWPTPRRLLAAALILGSAGAQAAIIQSKGTWTSTLEGRDASGNPVALLDGAGNAPNPDLKYVYDTVLNLTWLANWNAGAGSSFDNYFNTSDGRMTWANANAWAASLTDPSGVGGWMLPGVLDTGAPGCQFGVSSTDCGYNVYGSEAGRAAGSPLAHMYYDTLGNKGYYDASGNYQSDYYLTNTGPFSNMRGDVYWSGTAYVRSPDDTAWISEGVAWTFDMTDGSQLWYNQGQGFSAVAVRPGDVFAAPIPEPGAVVLMGLGLAVVAVVRRRRTP